MPAKPLPCHAMRCRSSAADAADAAACTAPGSMDGGMHGWTLTVYCWMDGWMGGGMDGGIEEGRRNGWSSIVYCWRDGGVDGCALLPQPRLSPASCLPPLPGFPPLQGSSASSPGIAPMGGLHDLRTPHTDRQAGGQQPGLTILGT